MTKILLLILLLLSVCYGQEEQSIRILRIASDPSSPPFEFLENGEVVGFDMSFLEALRQQAGIFGYEIVQLPWAEVFEQVKAGQVDLAVSGVTINDVRKETYDFSVPYFLSTHKILALAGTDITSAQDLLNDKVVGARTGTTGGVAVDRILGEGNQNIRKFMTVDEGVQALANGEIDAYVDDSGIVEYCAKDNAAFVVISDPDAFEKEFYGFMFPKGSELKGELDPAITAALESADYEMIYQQWFATSPDVTILLEAGRLEDPYDVFTESAEELEWSAEEGNLEMNWDDGELNLEIVL